MRDVEGTDGSAAPPSVRRVVTGYGPDGSPTILSDGAATAVTVLPQVPGSALIDIWLDEQLPPDLQGREDPTGGAFQLMPAGTLFRVIDLAPSDAEPLWHQTQTIDFIYIASGGATFLYEGGEVDLVAGDTIVVRGMRHAWTNRGTEVCRIIDGSVTTA